MILLQIVRKDMMILFTFVSYLVLMEVVLISVTVI